MTTTAASRAPAGTSAPPERSGVIRVQAGPGRLTVPFRELWAFRDLLLLLTWREISVRYKQTVLGVTWAALQPALTMLIFTFVFAGIAKVPSSGLPYPVFALAGLLPWGYFSQAIARSGASLVTNSNLVSKVYFPRLIVPLAHVLAPLADFAVAFGLLLLLMLAYRVTPTWGIVALPLFMLFAVISALAVSLWLSALHALYRDVGHTIPFLVQFWMYASPVAYPVSLVPARWRLLYALNPMAGVIEGFRWALLGTPRPDFRILCASSAAVLLLLAGGLAYFRKTEETLADLI